MRGGTIVTGRPVANAVDPRMAAMSTSLPELFLYTRPGCHLCDDARTFVQSLLEDRAARGLRPAIVRERDITTDPAWERAFFDRIPVIELGGHRLELTISPSQLRRLLADALDGSLV